MKFTELKGDIKSGRRGVYLFEGDDAYFRTSAERQILSAYVGMQELNYTSFDGTVCKGAAIRDITAALEVFPLMSEVRAVKVTEFYPTDSDYEKYLKPFIENFPDTALLMIINSQSKKGTDLKRKKGIAYFDCNKVDRETVARWAYLTMKKAGISSSVEACEAVADYCLCDMARVSGEVEKLIEWGRDAARITKADVDELVYREADYRVYQMTGAVSRRDYDSFCGICYDLLSKGYDQLALISALVNYFKNLLTALVSKKPREEVCASLKMTDYVFGKTCQQAKAIGRERLLKYIDGLYSLSSAAKSGQITSDGALASALQQVLFL